MAENQEIQNTPVENEKEIVEETKEAGATEKEVEAETPVEKKRKPRARTIAISDALEAKTPRDAEHEALVLLTGSNKGKKILTAKIEGIETLGAVGLAAVFHVNRFKVFIPASQCITIPEGTSEDRISYALSKRLGSEIDYIVRGIETKDKIVIASRLDAMEVIKRNSYFKRDRNSTRFRIEEGDKVEARVVATRREGIYVEAFGVEAFIPVRELSYNRIQDATAVYSNDDKVLCKITKLERNVQERKIKKIELSVKQTMPDPRELAVKEFQVGSKYVGTISMVDEHGVFVHLNCGDQGVDVLCKYPDRGENPQRGARATIRITLINPEEKRIFGVITHIGSIKS